MLSTLRAGQHTQQGAEVHAKHLLGVTRPARQGKACHAHAGHDNKPNIGVHPCLVHGIRILPKPISLRARLGLLGCFLRSFVGFWVHFRGRFAPLNFGFIISPSSICGINPLL